MAVFDRKGLTARTARPLSPARLRKRYPLASEEWLRAIRLVPDSIEEPLEIVATNLHWLTCSAVLWRTLAPASVSDTKAHPPNNNTDRAGVARIILVVRVFIVGFSLVQLQRIKFCGMGISELTGGTKFCPYPAPECRARCSDATRRWHPRLIASPALCDTG